MPLQLCLFKWDFQCVRSNSHVQQWSGKNALRVFTCIILHSDTHRLKCRKKCRTPPDWRDALEIKFTLHQHTPSTFSTPPWDGLSTNCLKCLNWVHWLFTQNLPASSTHKLTQLSVDFQDKNSQRNFLDGARGIVLCHQIKSRSSVK